MRSYQTEFNAATYSLTTDLVNGLLGRGWEDASWHNDACPSFVLRRPPAVVYRLWIDAESPADRELGGSRFTLCTEEGGTHAETLWQCDEAAEVLRRIQDL